MEHSLWAEAGFDDPEEIAAWQTARCFTPEAARHLEDAGLTPEQAAWLVNANGAEDTIGYHVTHGNLSLAAARRIITSVFWND
jgi:hypothetical protein